jgi:hypothetical protein
VKRTTVSIADLEDIKRSITEMESTIKTISSNSVSTFRTRETREILNKVFEAIKEMFEKFKEIIHNLGQIKITTTEQKGNDNLTYATTINIEGDITNTFPTDINDTIWQRHNSLVDNVINIRKDIIIKLIEIIGIIVKMPI